MMLRLRNCFLLAQAFFITALLAVLWLASFALIAAALALPEKWLLAHLRVPGRYVYAPINWAIKRGMPEINTLN